MPNFTHSHSFREVDFNDSHIPQQHADADTLFFIRMFARTYQPAI